MIVYGVLYLQAVHRNQLKMLQCEKNGSLLAYMAAKNASFIEGNQVRWNTPLPN
ncbi:hypothetical protein JHK82_017604 [Glycine max]|nr:hypothetical protein JHK82_017604 [Glycine max]KHN06344.1 hypothetical protein glysoja_021182 [Glycine soja]